jgi:hypothetical protein
MLAGVPDARGEVMKRIWIVVGALALAFAAAAAGCGGDGGGDQLTKEEYQQEVKKVGDTLSSSAGGLSSAFGQSDPESLDQVADEIEKLQQAMEDAADDLDNLTPPDDAQSAHDKLVEGIRGFADEIGGVADAARDGDLAALRDFGEGFEDSESVKQIQEATEELQSKGYTLEQ